MGYRDAIKVDRKCWSICIIGEALLESSRQRESSKRSLIHTAASRVCNKVTNCSAIVDVIDPLSIVRELEWSEALRPTSQVQTLIAADIEVDKLRRCVAILGWERVDADLVLGPCKGRKCEQYAEAK